jgi:hypothetical protein
MALPQTDSSAQQPILYVCIGYGKTSGTGHSPKTKNPKFMGPPISLGKRYQRKTKMSLRTLTFASSHVSRTDAGRTNWVAGFDPRQILGWVAWTSSSCKMAASHGDTMAWRYDGTACLCRALPCPVHAYSRMPWTRSRTPKSVCPHTPPPNPPPGPQAIVTLGQGRWRKYECLNP